MFLFGAGEGNRTPLSRLETCGNSHYTTPAWVVCGTILADLKSLRKGGALDGACNLKDYGFEVASFWE